MPEHARDLGADHVPHQDLAFRWGQRREPARQAVRGLGGRPGHRPAGADRDQTAQQRGHVALQPHRGQVEQRGRQDGLVVAECRVEQLQPLLDRQGDNAFPGDPAAVAVRQARDHPDLRVPRAPGQRDRRQAVVPAVFGQGVQERVPGGVAALPRVAQESGDGGEHDEPGQLAVAGRLVQVPGGVHLAAQHGVQAVRGERVDHAVVQRARRVHHDADRVLVRDGRQRRVQGGAVGHVAGHERRGGTVLHQLGHQLRRALGGRTSAAQQQEVPHAVGGDQVFGHLPAEATGRTGDHDRAGRVPGEPRRRGGDSGQPGNEDPVIAHEPLRLVGAEGVEQRRGPGVDVDQAEPAGVLGLRRPHESPHRRRGGVGTGRRPSGHEHQP